MVILRLPGVYFVGGMNPRTDQEVYGFVCDAIHSNKNESGVVFEIACHGEVFSNGSEHYKKFQERTSSGGTYYDVHVAMELNEIAHYVGSGTRAKGTKENRWCVSPDNLSLVAVWFTDENHFPTSSVSFA